MTGLRIEDRTEHMRPCLDCGYEFPHITGYVYGVLGPVAVYYASCHTDRDAGDAARLDVVLGSWGVDPPAGNHVTFSCELRPVGAMALDAPLTLTAVTPILGRTLTREQALAHPLLTEFWAVVDIVAAQDPAVQRTVYGSSP